MALALHTNWLKGSYKEDRDYIIRMGENDKLYKGVKQSGESWVFGTRPYNDGSIAIGYGFDLRANRPEFIAYFLGTIGISVTAAQIEAIQKKSGGPTLADFSFLDLGSETTARQLMDNVLDRQNNSFKGKEVLLNWLFQELGLVLGDSRERAVLVSMYYQAGAKNFGARDTIEGDAKVVSADRTWSVTRTVTTDGHVTYYSREYSFYAAATSGDTGNDDVIYDGAGNGNRLWKDAA